MPTLSQEDRALLDRLIVETTNALAVESARSSGLAAGSPACQLKWAELQARLARLQNGDIAYARQLAGLVSPEARKAAEDMLTAVHAELAAP